MQISKRAGTGQRTAAPVSESSPEEGGGRGGFESTTKTYKILPSLPAEANWAFSMPPSAELVDATAVTGPACSDMILQHLPVSRSHTLHVVSRPAET